MKEVNRKKKEAKEAKVKDAKAKEAAEEKDKDGDSVIGESITASQRENDAGALQISWGRRPRLWRRNF